MSWDYRFSREADKQFRRLPRDRQEQIVAVLEDTRENPFAGDVLPIKSGRSEGAFRRRIGRYRLIFEPNPTEHIIKILSVGPRSEKTYR
jgi:mRNA-degrading endonuclease RelE of RelBE toxin-antitoxin system